MSLVSRVCTFLLKLFLIDRFRALTVANPKRSYRFYLAYCWMALIFYLLSIPLMFVGVLVEGQPLSLLGIAGAIFLFPVILRFVVGTVVWMNGLVLNDQTARSKE
jgi:hypothetical protein